MRVFAIRRDDKVTVIIGTKHYKRSGDLAMSMYAAAQQYKATKLEEDLESLLDLVNPYEKYIRQGILREKDGNLFLGDTEVPLPSSLAETITEYLDNGFPIESLANFWHWCLLNPSTTARDRFFEYCQNYGVTITDSGMAVLYKAVTQIEDNRASDLAHFVAAEWIQLKAGKRDQSNSMPRFHPSVFSVRFTKNGSFETFLHDEGDEVVEGYIGNLDELFSQIHKQELEGKTVYTDKYSCTMNIKLGVPVFKPRDQCDPNIKNECSFGLHVGSFQYVKRFGYGNDTVFATLVNPMNVVALPHYDNSKIRVCEYYPYAIMNREDDNEWEELPSSFFEGEYTPYSARALQEISNDIQERLKNVEVDSEAFQIIKSQQTVVRTKLLSIYEEQPDALTKDVEEPIEAPFEESFFDTDDEYAHNQYAYVEDSGWAEKSLAERANKAWKEDVLNGIYEGSFSDYLEHEYEDDDEEDDEDWDDFEDECPECGYTEENCRCDSTTITENFARHLWNNAVACGETILDFKHYVEQTLASNDTYVHDWDRYVYNHDSYGRKIIETREKAVEIWKEYLQNPNNTLGLRRFWELRDENLDSEYVYPPFSDEF